MSPRQVALLYAEGVKLREDARQLNNKTLAKKFERSERTITKVANRMPCRVPDDEQDLIRACISERDRLKSQASELSFKRPCFKHGVTRGSLAMALESMGIWEVAA